MLPTFITFTGVDTRSSVPELMALAADYPVEFAFMFSPARQGSARFPPLRFIAKVLAMRNNRFRLAAHLCDGYCDNLVEHNATGLEQAGVLNGFARVQVNSDNPKLSPKKIAAWAKSQGGMSAILLCSASFPAQEQVQWFFDTSKGTGTRPEHWPPAPGERLVGYAGGINPGNVAQVCRQIGRVAQNYWIDMASGVRDEQNRFDLDKCRQVCQAVYGKPGRR